MSIVSWKEILKKRIMGQEKNVPWFLHDKIKCNNFCIENDIKTTKIYRVFDSAEEITFSDLDEMDFILKPTLESSTKGVMVLKREDRGYFDSLSRKHISFDEIIAIQDSLFAKNKNKANKIILEEKIYDENHQYNIPRDFKFYSFNGRIAAIVEINRNSKPSLVTWYTGNFELLDDGVIETNPKYVELLKKNERPLEWEQLLKLASDISKKINTPFSRIDVYSSTKGPILGEITLAPGGLYHGLHYSLSPVEDRKWGEYWIQAKHELDALNKTSDIKK